MTNLKNLNILITRPEPQGTELCKLIIEQGGQAFNFPTIEFAPPPNPQMFQMNIAKLPEQDWLIFISPHSVRTSLAYLKNLPATTHLAAVGEGTAKILYAAGHLSVLFPHTNWTSEGLLDLSEFKAIENQKIAIIRGSGGREFLDKELRERGAKVLTVIAYERVIPKLDSTPILNLFKQHAIDMIVCTSYEAVKNLKILFGESGWPHLKNLPLIVMSERIKILARDLGFQTIWITRNASQAAIIDRMAEIRKK